MCIPEVRVDGRLSLHYSPPRKRSVFGQGTRYTDPPNGRKVLALHHISELRSAQHLSAILTSSHSHIPKMAARSCVARAARQLTFAAARRPAPFACQRGQLQAQKQRLFSVSAACMSKHEFTFEARNCADRVNSEGEAVHRGP
jgi:hypothetical protein